MRREDYDRIARGGQIALVILGLLLIFLSFLGAYMGWKATDPVGPALASQSFWLILLGPMAAISGTAFVFYGIPAVITKK